MISKVGLGRRASIGDAVNHPGMEEAGVARFQFEPIVGLLDSSPLEHLVRGSSELPAFLLREEAADHDPSRVGSVAHDALRETFLNLARFFNWRALDGSRSRIPAFS